MDEVLEHSRLKDVEVACSEVARLHLLSQRVRAEGTGGYSCCQQ